MGLLRRSMRSVLPTATKAVATAVPTWQQNLPQLAPQNFERFAREGYGKNEVVYACIETRCDAVMEPRLAVYCQGDDGEEQLPEHPFLALMHRPNPFMGRAQLIAATVLFRDVAGNAYWELVRNRAGKIVEAWPLRPDRMRVIPDPQTFIKGYEYRVGDQVFRLEPRDVIHFKTRNPFDDYYGLPPLAVAAQRVDVDLWMRQFTAAFFTNAGVPAGLLNIKQRVQQAERELIRQQFRGSYGGPGGWHSVAVIDGQEVEYTAMGMPLGERGIAYPDLDEISEARICMTFKVPPSVIATRLGMRSSSYANRVSDRELFVEQSIIPLLADLASTLSMELADEYPDIDRIGFDYESMRVLSEDQDKKHARVREDAKSGLVGRKQAAQMLGYPEPEPDDVYLVPANLVPTPVNEIVAPALPEPVAPLGEPSPPVANGTANGQHA